ncbi:HD domain-containing protein, partial [Candidatus Micrarchaeota archaeon]|nr:HD domain-containing protein [Candidatus Micrarchaeota archaeon]
MRIIKDPLYGSIKVSECELKVIDTPDFQRLRRIKQLAMAFLVYPGANHTRFEHSLGTMFLTQKICENLDFTGDTTELLRITALLHDIGHGPFSHESDEILKEYFNLSHEDVGLSRIKNSQLKDLVGEAGYTLNDIKKIFFGKGYGEIITSEVGSDRMDYLVRDSHNTGVAYGIIDTDRIINTVQWDGGKLVVDESGLEAAESLLIARFLMFSTVYLHHTVRIASGMLKKSIYSALKEKVINPKDFLHLDDNLLLTLLQNARNNNLVKMLEKRQLYKRVYEISWQSLSEKGRAIFTDPKKRLVAEKEISETAGVEEEEVVLCAPTRFVKEKELYISTNGNKVLFQNVSDLAKSITEAAQN